MIQEMTATIMALMKAHGPIMVFVGVIIESIIVPIPSPLIIMGAGALFIAPDLAPAAAFVPIVMKIVVPGAVASTLGAYFAYGIAYWGGKPIIDRYHKWLGFSWDDVLKMEPYFVERTGLMIFLLRALPVIPLSLISAVAGVLRLPATTFTLWTFIGSIPRCLILGYLGHFMRESYEGFAGNLNRVESLISMGIVVAVFAVIFWVRFKLKQK